MKGSAALFEPFKFSTMSKCKSYEQLPQAWKSEVDTLVRKMCGKSHIADVEIEDSDLKGYKFKVTVCKYNSVKGWATIGYIRQDNRHRFRLTYQPRQRGEERSSGRVAGRTGAYS